MMMVKRGVIPGNSPDRGTEINCEFSFAKQVAY